MAAGLYTSPHGGHGPGATLVPLIEAISTSNRFVTGIAADLRRHDVVAAMRAGLSPDGAGLTADLFPPSYRELFEIDAAIDEARQARDRADGADWNPFDGDHDRVAGLDRDLATLRFRRAAVAKTIGASNDSRLTEVEAIAALAAHTGDRAWEGSQYADWVLRYRQATSSSLDGGRLRLDDEGGDDTQDEFTFIGTRVADHDEAATGFYATLDVEGTAHLPTLLADNLQHRGDRDTRHDVFANYGTALAAASRARDTSGAPVLGFNGRQMIEVARPLVQTNVYWHHPALLFTTGQFDPAFLAHATAATIDQAESAAAATNALDRLAGDLTNVAPINPGTTSMIGTYRRWWTIGGPVPVHDGEDPRNVLLARAAESPEAAALTVAELHRRDPNLDALLFAQAG